MGILPNCPDHKPVAWLQVKMSLRLWLESIAWGSATPADPAEVYPAGETEPHQPPADSAPAAGKKGRALAAPEAPSSSAPVPQRTLPTQSYPVACGDKEGQLQLLPGSAMPFMVGVGGREGVEGVDVAEASSR